MKNLKKILSSILALALCASMLPSAFAEGETTEDATSAAVQPEVLVFRDYEDLSEGETRYNLAQTLIFNQSGNFGTTKLGTNSGVGVDPVVVNGADGQGLRFDTRASDSATSGGFGVTETTGYSTGKIYIAFDMQRKSDAELDAQDGTTDGYYVVTNEETGAEEKQYVKHDTYLYFNDGIDPNTTQQYGRIYTRHTNSKAAPWAGTNPGVYIPDENVHRYEYIIDLDNDTFKGYVDGAQVGNGTTYAYNFLKFNLFLTNAIKYFDNFTMVHYPTDIAKTYSLTGKGADVVSDTLSVDIDSDTKTVTDTATYTANYPVVLNLEEGKTMADYLTVTNAAGEAVAVESVTENGAFSSYDIKLADGIVLGETYTVTLASGLTDVLGATVSSGTAVFTVPAPTVLYYRDYENYTTGGEVLGNTYGTASMGNNANLNSSSAAVTGVDGIAVDTGTASGSPAFTLSEALTTGKLYVGMDVEAHTEEEVAENGISFGSSYVTVRSTDFNAAEKIYGKYIYFASGTTWEGVANYGTLQDGKYHRLDVIFDLDTKKVHSYIDGEEHTTVTYPLKDINYVNVMLSAGVKKWDNFTVVYYPTGSQDTFSLAGKGVNYDANTITVDFDNNAQTTVDTTTYAANYPTILTSDITPEDVTVTNAAGEAVTVSAVNKNAAFGSYDLVLEETLVEGETYTVSVASDLTSTLGAAIDETTATVSAAAPEVLIYRDYENYSAGADIYNRSGAYGSWKAPANTGFALGITPAEGADGIAITTPASTNGTTFGSWREMFPEVLTEGKFYLGYDIQKKSDEEFNAMDGETPVVHELLGYFLVSSEWGDNYQRYLRNSASHSSITKGLGSWHIPIAQYYIGSGYNRIEYIVDLDADMIYLYVNGVQEASNTFTANLYGYAQEMENCVKYFDNFTMVHVPNDAKAQTFSLQDANADKDAKTISVKLRSDIDGAAYPIITEELTASDFVVMDAEGVALTITGVEKGTAFGEYVITVADDLIENTKYTVATSAERTDNLGATLDTNATATAYVAPDVYFDLGFDGYTGIGTTFSPYTFNTQKVAYQQANEDAKWGTGLDIILPDGETWYLTEFTKKFEEPINEGKLTISFDYIVSEFQDKRQAIQMKNSSGSGLANKDGNIYLLFFDYSDGKALVRTLADPNGWGYQANTLTLEDDTMYHFDLVFDYDAKNYSVYVNGSKVTGYDVAINPGTMDAKSITFLINVGTKFFDNVKVAYSDSDSFGIDKAAWHGDYAEVLLSEGANAESLALADSVVVTDNATGTAVEATVELSGRRVLISGLDSTKSYTVTMPEAYTSVTGNTLTENTAVINAGEFEIVSVDLTDADGKAITKADLVAGDKVYATVTYQNHSGKDETFTLLGATYAEGRMTDTNFKNITASGSVKTKVTETVELDVTDVTELEIKAFTVESLANLKPLGNVAVK